MTGVPVLGSVFLPSLPPERLRAMVQNAERSGLDELWLWEDCFFESGLATMAAALAWSDRLRVGVGLLPVPLRNAAIAAMEMATLERLFPGRGIVAIGHGVQSWMGQVGVRAESPMTLLREYTVALRTLLRGEEATTKGRYVQLDGVKLVWPPAAGAIHIGATGAKSIRLSGELADGTVLSADVSPDGVRAARALIEEGRALSGRVGPHRVTAYLVAATGADAADRVARTRAYFSIPEGVGVAGDAEAIADTVRAYAEAGADAVILQPTADDPDQEGFVRFVSDEVRALIS